MNYEVRYVNPVSVLINALRVLVIMGFVIGVFLFFVPNRGLYLPTIGAKILATLAFTVVYSVMVSVLLTLAAWLYNLWAANSKGISIHLEQKDS